MEHRARPGQGNKSSFGQWRQGRGRNRQRKRPRSGRPFGRRRDTFDESKPTKRFEAERKFHVGTVSHFFAKISVATVKIQKGSIVLGDVLMFETGTEVFKQKILSMQVNHENVDRASVGAEIGIKVDRRVKEGDLVYRCGQ